MLGPRARTSSLLRILPVLVRRRRSAGIVLFLAVISATPAVALDIGGPAGSVHFGTSVKVLPNGNIVVTDPDANSPNYSGVGAVYLYGPNGNQISKITGSQPDDHVGDAGISVLANGNYVIASRQWRNGTAALAGAVTWASASSGISGVVSAGNSLVGSTAGDQVGSVTVLTNDNYVVSSQAWDNSAIVDAGAVTWCNGNGTTVGPVSSSNSLVGTSASDNVGYFGAVALANGNYVTSTPNWDDGAVADVGAVTWGDGGGGTVGAVSASNSLIGSSIYDAVGGDGVRPLGNGNYVVSSSGWSNGATLYVGAVTWGNGGGGTVGAVSASNSLVGDEANDGIGRVVTVLSNDNYVVSSQNWHGNVGAATWGNGNGGTVGEISAANSLVGSAPEDRIGGEGAIALSNGHYVVFSSHWNGKLGAATWANGGGGTVGAVSALNSLTGAATLDYVGATGGVALRNGNYAVSSAYFNGVGAATWGYGNGGTVGTVSAANSTVGTTAGDQFGIVTALSNGNFVAFGSYWDDGATADVGAVTWMSGNGGTVGPVSAANSLIGGSANDTLGAGGALALANGDYVVVSPYWDNAAVVEAGAVTWGNGNGGSSGLVAASNSLVGTSAGDSIGSNGVVALGNGSYVVMSPQWNNAAIAGAGAITLRRGNDRLGATVTAENSVRGAAENGGDSMVFDYGAARDQLVVGRPAENLVTLFKADLLFREGFD